MLIADVDGRAELAQPGLHGACPGCALPVRARCGQVVTWHWAHHARAGCRFDREPETEWHRAWKLRFPLERVERRVGDLRADVLLADGRAVEFQHSPISADEIARREAGYGRMVWVFDVAAAYRADRFDLRRPRGSNSWWTFRWMHPRKSIAWCRRQVVLDLGGGLVLRLGKLYPDAPCGGYGWPVTADQLVADLLGHDAAGVGEPGMIERLIAEHQRAGTRDVIGGPA